MAAKSECIKILLFLLKLLPRCMFGYSTSGQRPYDIVQKNYTLSKILQASEEAYIATYIHRSPPAIKTEAAPVHTHMTRAMERKLSISQPLR